MKAFFSGMAIGAAVGVLIAPQSGNRTQQKIRSTFNKLVGKTKQLTDTATERASELSQQVSETIDKFVPHAESLAQDTPQSSGILMLLNTVSREDLLRINGIGPVLADRFIAARPFESKQQVLDRRILPEPVFNDLLRELEAA
jgi:DNA uptake protein ComE-like DNA-binding protein